jgi:predicted acetyltransferase
MLFLSEPALTYKISYLEAVREFHAEGRNLDLDYRDLDDHFQDYVRDWNNRKVNPYPGKVAESIFWLIDGETFIGRVSVRHDLNDSLRLYGGHIGYEIRPTQRRKGHGTAILRLGLEKAKAVSITRALVTCDDDNFASAKIIEANGGVLENIVLLTGHPVPVRRYWIDIP